MLTSLLLCVYGTPAVLVPRLCPKTWPWKLCQCHDSTPVLTEVCPSLRVFACAIISCRRNLMIASDDPSDHCISKKFWVTDKLPLIPVCCHELAKKVESFFQNWPQHRLLTVSYFAWMCCCSCCMCFFFIFIKLVIKEKEENELPSLARKNVLTHACLEFDSNTSGKDFLQDELRYWVSDMSFTQVKTSKFVLQCVQWAVWSSRPCQPFSHTTCKKVQTNTKQCSSD